MSKIILDAAHGGSDLGDVYNGRYEKNDTLKLALQLKEVLQEKYDFDVVQTRFGDYYISHVDRVNIINNESTDLIISIHRVSGETPLYSSGIVFYIYNEGGISEIIAKKIGAELANIEFPAYTIGIRTDLPLFRETLSPSLIMNIGYINSDIDNKIFDTKLNEIAEAIARGINEAF